MGVVEEIAAQEDARGYESRDHGRAMSGDQATLYKAVPDVEQDSSDAIQRGVDRREDAVVDLQVVNCGTGALARAESTTAEGGCAT